MRSDELTVFLLAGGSVLSMLCIGIDVVLFTVIDRYDRRMAEERYLRALESQLDWRMRRYDEMAAEMESIARVRHDLRNQLQVVTILAGKGRSRGRAGAFKVDGAVGGVRAGEADADGS